jgi:hypothetical protein
MFFVLGINTGVTVVFSQSTFTASEGDGIVLVCAELLIGNLETEISLFVDVLDLESNTGSYMYIVCIFAIDHQIINLLSRTTIKTYRGISLMGISWESDLWLHNDIKN